MNRSGYNSELELTYIEWRDLKVKLGLYDINTDGSVCVEEGAYKE